MKSLCKDLLLSCLMGLILPSLLLNGFARSVRQEPEPTRPEDSGPEVCLRRSTGAEEMLALEEYLVGVVLAEMPADFAPEALKAQAVAARTYAAKASAGGKHGDGSLCGESGCCQGWIGEADYLARGGTREALDKVRSAVHATAGMILTYEGEPIEAVYFSCSGGKTEDAAAVWGGDFPYLRAVESPGEEDAAHYRDTVTFTPDHFQSLLGVPLPGSPDTWFGELTRTEGGGVETVLIGGESYSGTQLRSLLGLRSTAFSINWDGVLLTVTTRGYGHRVGMSQYGADAMAVLGSGYQDILAHYYPGTQITSWSTEE